MSTSSPPAVLFVCLGNICRSPLAEAAFRARADAAGLDVEVDSAGTGSWHVGKAPDWRAQRVAARHGVDISTYRGRQIDRQDFDRFTYICALDHQNLADLQAMAPDGVGAKIGLLLDLVEGREGQAVDDPYWGDDASFERTWRQVDEAARALVEKLLG